MSVRVFVVDDTAHVRKMLVQMLELSGFDIVGQAASGTEAVEHIGEADPQVVVVDYKMPGLDGIETAREIRAHRPDQAIILYTAYLDDTLAEGRRRRRRVALRGEDRGPDDAGARHPPAGRRPF